MFRLKSTAVTELEFLNKYVRMQSSTSLWAAGHDPNTAKLAQVQLNQVVAKVGLTSSKPDSCREPDPDDLELDPRSDSHDKRCVCECEILHLILDDALKNREAILSGLCPS